MDISPNALYLDLLDDLSGHLKSDIISALRRGESVDWWPDATPRQVACLSLAKSFLKKYEDDQAEHAEHKALEKFLATNSRVGDWSLQLESTKDEVLLGELKSLLYEFFYPSGDPLITSYPQILDEARCGPGASIGALGNDFYTKMFSSPLTCTSRGLYSAYAAYTEYNPSWHRAEYQRTLSHGEYSIVTGSRLSFVPKNVDIARIICVEPSLNMFFQLGTMHILNERLRQFFGIDMSRQPEWNRALAWVGSLDKKENGLVTIDLSEASDSMGMGMLKEILPPYVYGWFDSMRSPNTTLPNGDKLQLNMISTMGNGFTFPLQTCLFACAVLACMRFRHIRVVRPSARLAGNFSVFGDDIICYKDIAADVCRLLGLLGFRVNNEKSFFEGPFRESCGCDYFRGHNVRGVYVKTLKTPQARYAVINRLNEWSGKTGIFLPHTVRRLIRSVRFLPVPVWENEDAGIRIPFSLVHNQRRHKNYQSIIYTKMVPRQRRMKIREGKVSVPKGEKIRDYNPEGLLQAFLRGDIVSGTITLRSRFVLYHPKLGVAPNWDFMPDKDYSETDRCFPNREQRRRWETAVRANI